MKKILIADDEALIRRVLQTFLNSYPEGFEMLFAADGNQALEQAIQHRPDAILLDINMPGLNGYDVCKTLRSDTAQSYIPIIFITGGIGDVASRIRGYEVGGDDFITKPLDRSELYARLNSALRIKELQDELRRERDLLEQKVRDRTSELRNAYRTLRQSEEQYRSIFESFQDVYFRTELDGHISLVSPSVEALMGAKPAQLIGRPIQEMYHDPAIFAHITERLKLKGTLENLELAIKHADGSLRVGSLNIHTLLNDELQPVALEGVLRDITELRNAEHQTKSQQQQLIQADKMATLGILASGIAHEINNPNNLIMLNHDILASLWEHIVVVLDGHARIHPGFMLGNAPYDSVREELPDFLTGIAEGSIRIKTIVEHLKDFARMDTGHIDQRLEINEVVRRAVFIVNNLIKKSTSTFELQLTAGLPEIIGNMQKLEQVVINLLTNACQALRSSSQTIRIQTLHATQPPGVVLRVIDEGCGISAEDLPRVLNPFFTTKRDSGGTGLGLSVSYSIIEEHGGTLSFSSKEGEGTTVTVTLPLPTPQQTQSEHIS